MEDDEFIQCPACNSEGIDLDGFVCWKCRGDGQITHDSTSKDSTDTRSISLHAKTNADQHPAAIIALHNPLLLVFRIDSNNITEITIHKEHFFTTSGTNRIGLVYFNLTYLL